MQQQQTRNKQKLAARLMKFREKIKNKTYKQLTNSCRQQNITKNIYKGATFTLHTVAKESVAHSSSVIRTQSDVQRSRISVKDFLEFSFKLKTIKRGEGKKTKTVCCKSWGMQKKLKQNENYRQNIENCVFFNYCSFKKKKNNNNNNCGQFEY